MSRQIDERVVQMQFDSAEFNRNIQASIRNLDQLKRGLNFEDSVKGFEDIDRAARDTDIGVLGKAVEQVQLKFGLLEVFALRVMTRISDAAINMGERLVKSLTIDQVTPGWDKYGKKTTSVQTIMAATAKQFSDTAEQMEVVNEQLNKLNWFTDETSYNFVDMVNNIGKFTSNNIALDESVTAMQGIANWAAISGANAGEASRAMYNLAQALATGTVKLIDWKSIENANMATTEFKQTVIDIAEELGTLKKVGEDVWMTLDGKTQVSSSNFNEGLSKGWFTNDVLMRALDRYGGAVNKLNEIYESLGAEVTTSRIVASINEYLAAVDDARAESEKFGLDVEATNKKIAESGAEVAKEVAKDWGISIEEATEILAQFDDEAMRFGLKAFAAAQEAKTFEEAIDSVKDAVSTGWMKTFEYLFGNYTEAKEFWTNIANTLYDIFATSGDIRNEVLETWYENHGRDYFVDTIYAGLAAIMSILSPIKAAWEEVFGRLNADALLEFTIRVHDFVLSLVQSEESMQKIARTFRGVFSVLDIIKTVITRVVGGALSVLQRVLAELNLDVGEFAASLGDGLYAIRNWVKQTDFITPIFVAIGDAIVAVVRQIKAFIGAVNDTGVVQAILAGLRATFTEDFQGIGGIISALGKTLKWLFDQLRNFRMPTSFEDILQFFKNFGSTVKMNFEAIGIDFSWLEGVFSAFGKSFSKVFGGINNAITTSTGVIGGAIAYLRDLFNNIDWAGVILVAFGVATLAVIWKMADAIGSFGAALENLTGVGKAAKETFESITGYFNALKANVKSNNLIKIAVSITMLAVSFALLANLDWDAVKNGLWAMAGIGGVLVVLSFTLSKFDKLGLNGKAISSFILSVGAAVLLIALSLRAIPELDDGELLKRFLAITGVIIAMMAVTTIMEVFAKQSEVKVAGFLGFAAAIFILIQTMKRIGAEDISAIWAAAPVVAVLMLVLAALSQLLVYQKSMTMEAGGVKSTVKNGGAFMNVIAIVVGLMGMISVIKKLGNMDVEVAFRGILLMIPLVVLLGVLFKAASAAGKHASSAGKMMLYLSVGLAILLPVIKAYAKVDLGILVRGGAAIAGISTFILAPLIVVSQFAGKYAAKAGLMLLEIAGALAVIQLVVKTLGRVDLVTLTKGIVSVSVLIGALSLTIFALNSNAAASEHTVKALTKLTIIIGIISALILALTIIDPVGALAVSAGLSAVFASLGYLFKNINNIKLPDMKSMISLSAMIAIIGAAVGLIAKFTEWQNALAAAAGISLVMVAVSNMIKQFDKEDMSIVLEEAFSLAIVIGAIGGVVAGLSYVYQQFMRSGGTIADYLSMTTGLSEVIVAVSELANTLNEAEFPDLSNMTSLGVAFGAIVAVVAGFGFLIGLAKKFDWDISNLLLVTTGVSEIMLAMAKSIEIMSEAEPPEFATEQVIAMGIMIAAIGVVLGIVTAMIKDVDMVKTLSFATGISEILMAFGVAVKLMNEAEFNLDWKQIAGLSAFVASVGGVLAGLSGMTDPYSVLPLALGMSLVIIATAAAALIMSKIPEGAIMGALEGIAIAIIFVVAMGALIGTLGAIMDKYSQVETWLQKGVEVFGYIGEAIGNFFGSLWGGALKGIGQNVADLIPYICQKFSEGIQNLIPGFTALQNMPGGIIELIIKLAVVLGIMTAASFLSAVSALPGIGQILEAGAKALSERFTQFGIALNDFAYEIRDIDADKVLKAAQAVLYLGTLETSLTSLEHVFGTILGNIFGTDNMEEFGKRLRALGRSLVYFADEVEDLNVDAVEKAAACADMLIELERGLPRKDGVLQEFLGQDSFSKLATRLELFADSLVYFGNKTAEIEEDSYDKAIAASTKLIELENSLDPQGGIHWLLFGNQDLGAFGQRLYDFGVALLNAQTQVEDLDASKFLAAATIGEKLAGIESSLAPQGGVRGMWLGNSSFSAFGSNLKDFGTALYNFYTTIEDIDFTFFLGPIDYIKELIGLDGLAQARENAIKSITNILEAIKTTFTNNNEIMKNKGHDIIYWIVRGFETGVNDYNDRIAKAAVKIANTFVDTFEDEMEIHSPSLVMDEEGHWVVKGLAEGITNETSAEEAATKKAQNIVSAFESVLSKFSTAQSIAQLEFELWELTDGKTATEFEKTNKQLELETQKLSDLASEVSMRRQALDYIAQELGEDSTEYQNAYKALLQAEVNMRKQEQQIKDNFGSTSSTDQRTAANMYVQYMKDYEQAYTMLGKTREELEEAAYKYAYGMSQEDVGRLRVYRSYVSKTDEELRKLGIERDKLVEYAQQNSGWSGFDKFLGQSSIDTAAIIDEGLNSYKVDLDATLDLYTAEVIENTKSSKSSSSRAAGSAGSSLGETFGESFKDGISQALGGGGGGGKEDGFSILSGWEALQNVMDGGWFGEFDLFGTMSEVPGLTDAIQSLIVDPSADTLSEIVEMAREYGVDTVKGYVDSISDGSLRDQVWNAVESAMVDPVGAVAGALGINSPSKVTYAYGEFVGEGFVLGIQSMFERIMEAGEGMVKNLLDPLDYAAKALDAIVSQMEGDGDLQPVITPVIDMDEIRKQAARIPSLISKTSGISISNITARASQISSLGSNKNSGHLAQIGGNTGSVNYNFTQNNYSPKALSRVDIYRQTNNQFSRLKEATKG